MCHYINEQIEYMIESHFYSPYGLSSLFSYNFSRWEWEGFEYCFSSHVQGQNRRSDQCEDLILPSTSFLHQMRNQLKWSSNRASLPQTGGQYAPMKVFIFTQSKSGLQIRTDKPQQFFSFSALINSTWIQGFGGEVSKFLRTGQVQWSAPP